MDGCGCDEYASQIDDRTAQEYRDDYHAGGPDETTAILIEMIKGEGVEDATILDVGGGIGVIDHELLRAGARSAVIAEASLSFIRPAREEARVAGLADRIEVVEGDFVRRAGAFEPADIVTLDRVICCYPDVDALVATSAARARRLYGLVLPPDRWSIRLLTWLENVSHWLRRDRYRAFAHSNERIDAQLAALGLSIRAEATTRMWRVVLYGRDVPLEGRAVT
jgi:tRNA1(Val) A37 N6-methylase TrmN6